MRRAVVMVCAAAMWIAAASAASAGEVVLRNGDRLTGEILQDGAEVVLEHPVLGTIRLQRSDCEQVLRHPAPPPPTSTSIPCDPCAGPTPAVEAPECPSPWTVLFTFGLSEDSGNTEKFTFNTDLEARYTRGKAEWLGRLRTNYETAQGTQTEGAADALLMYTRHFTKRDAWWVAGIYKRDDFADILLRNGWFGGVRRDFSKTKRTTLYGALGAGGVLENRTGEPLLTTPALWAELGYERKFSRGDSLTARAYAVGYVDETEWSPSHLELRYAHPLRDHLDITASFFLDYVPNPPDDIKPYDTKFVLGFRWRP